MKVFLRVVTVLLSAQHTFQACSSMDPHHYEEGERAMYDSLLYEGTGILPATHNQVHNVSLRWPPTGHMSNNQVLTKIELQDLLKNGYNGCIFKIAGGVGSIFVKLRIESQRGGPIAYNLRLYGL